MGEAMMFVPASSVAIVDALLLPLKGLPKPSNLDSGNENTGVVSLRSSGGADDGGKVSHWDVEGRISGFGPRLPAPNRRILRIGFDL
jgi:hypothetical protein